jgi:hypothetical protein
LIAEDVGLFLEKKIGLPKGLAAKFFMSLCHAMSSHELLGCLSRGGSYIQLSSTSNLGADRPGHRG